MSPSKPVKLVEGLYQIRLPIPIKALGYVYVYLVSDGAENLLIDAGWPSSEAMEVLQQSLSQLGVSFSQIGTIVVSHLHPDHFGLAEQIRDVAPKSSLVMHEADAQLILNDHEEYLAFVDKLQLFLGQNGTPKKELDAISEASSRMLNFFSPPRPTTLLKGEEILSVGNRWNFRVLSTPGHTVGTICLYDSVSKVLFAGDHVLPTITPNVSYGPNYPGNPLGDYLHSLKSVASLNVSLVLPSHEYVFSNLQSRTQEIAQHHDQRLEDALSVLKHSPGQSLLGYEVATKLKWYSGPWETLGSWERRAAIMETIAHLEYLRSGGEISMVNGRRKGEVRYTLAKK